MVGDRQVVIRVGVGISDVGVAVGETTRRQIRVEVDILTCVVGTDNQIPIGSRIGGLCVNRLDIIG